MCLKDALHNTLVIAPKGKMDGTCVDAPVVSAVLSLASANVPPAARLPGRRRGGFQPGKCRFAR